ncbi:hypothetical protein [Streptomyces sp. NPDC085596]|uniref:hypothetical protein n=1 Tax=Streptomyces sp. NPDC085596 TaxID=3365731 RepID=UPI0037D34725
MTTDEPRSGLPIEFLRTVAAEAGPESPPVRMAVERARELPTGHSRDDLLLTLLRGALSDSAPEWLLKVAVESDLAKETSPYPGPSMSLAAVALAHPECSDSMRKEALRRCSVPQLGGLGHSRCGEALAQAIVAELKSRVPHVSAMTPALLEEPSAPQLILREVDLHDTVFTTALDLLPTDPPLAIEDETDGDDILARIEEHSAALKAGEAMWKHIVTLHSRRHRQMFEWALDGSMKEAIRNHLLGTVPWEVEPSLLEEVATGHLSKFTVNELITRLCLMLRDGVPPDEVRSRIAHELDALEPLVRRRVEETLKVREDHLKYVLSAVSWVESAAAGPWRYLLDPSQATHYGQPRTWLASEELLIRLGQRFAETAVKALRLWEPDPEPDSPGPRQLQWVHAMLLHLPHLTDEVREKSKAVVRHVRPRTRSRWDYADLRMQQDDKRLVELRTAIERILADPSTASRESALGDPKQLTVRDLANAPDEALLDYLARHTDDDLVEKALLSFAWRSYRSGLSFSDVLARHSTPETALLQITMDLRRRLGGGPNLRETWTRDILALPNCTPELVRALPAWSALTVRGARHGVAHTTVASTVLAALGNDDDAWSRFATSPASYSGPTAWLRLGDVLKAAAQGEEWPKAPSTR